MKYLVSGATEKNWKRLNTDGRERLKKRANKRYSEKKFLAAEYLTDQAHRNSIQELLEQIWKYSWDADRVLYSLSVKMLEKKGILEKPHVKKVLSEYRRAGIEELEGTEIPEGEWDFLGAVYQGMTPEGQKNRKGSYYTPEKIARNMARELDFSGGQLFLDPCCGSGSFLMALKNAEPGQICGIDSDRTAVMIAKVNLLLKYPDQEFEPQIFCGDYLKENGTEEIRARRFDYIVTNPPWGAVCPKEQNRTAFRESFSCFFVTAYKQLKEGGAIRFLFPEAVLNVGAHKAFRVFLTERCRIQRITRYEGSFSGVATKYVDILCRKEKPGREVCFVCPEKTGKVPLAAFQETKNHTFCFLEKDDLEIIRRIKSRGRYDLSESVWALGIVTGDNKNKLKDKREEGDEPIFTGKEIERYILKPAEKYLRYVPSEFQQTAREEYYRAKEKLAYKFISGRLAFAYDGSGSLFLNSANLLLPAVPHMGIKTVMAFLNSELFQFFYRVLFGENKILKGNLMQIPFPEITEEQNREIETAVERIMGGEKEQDVLLQERIYGQYGLEKGQIRHIRNRLSLK